MLATGTRILVCVQPQDMRKSFDGLALVARELLGEDPQCGALYVFVSRSATRAKVLWWDRNGYCLLAKRLDRALFRLPVYAPKVGSAMQVDAEALRELLAGVEKKSAKNLHSIH